MDQNSLQKLIMSPSIKPPEKKKNSSSNFNFGNYKTNFKTVSYTDYEPKTPALMNKKCSGQNLRTHSFKMGDDMIDYTSDNKLRYSNPNVKKTIKYFFFKNFYI